MHNTNERIANPGPKTICGATSIYWVPSRIILPQEAAGGCMPRPKNDKPASAIITLATENVASIINGAIINGKMCFNAIK